MFEDLPKGLKDHCKKSEQVYKPWYARDNNEDIYVEGKAPAVDENTKLREHDLKIYTVWESVNGNLFIKLTDEYSIAIGPKDNHDPSEGELKRSQYVKSNNICPVKAVGRIIFDKY